MNGPRGLRRGDSTEWIFHKVEFKLRSGSNVMFVTPCADPGSSQIGRL